MVKKAETHWPRPSRLGCSPVEVKEVPEECDLEIEIEIEALASQRLQAYEQDKQATVIPHDEMLKRFEGKTEKGHNGPCD